MAEHGLHKTSSLDVSYLSMFSSTIHDKFTCTGPARRLVALTMTLRIEDFVRNQLAVIEGSMFGGVSIDDGHTTGNPFTDNLYPVQSPLPICHTAVG